MDRVDVVVVGAGLAGLRCAVRLEEDGYEVAVVEAADQVGGRLRTDVVDGFRLDRGFAVLNPAYPAARRWLDLAALQLRPFGHGVLVRRESGIVALADPLRHADRLAETLASGYVDPAAVLALGRWLLPALVAPGRAKRAPDRALAAAFDAVGFAGPLREQVAEPFLAGVLAADPGPTSAGFVRLLARCFALGRPSLPAEGMGAIGAQLAGRLRRPVRLGAAVTRVGDGPDGCRVETAAGAIEARAAVVAAGPRAGAELLGEAPAATHRLDTWYFASGDDPHPAPLLILDGRRAGGRVPGPVWNAAVVSHAAPEYAPPGRHLIQATTLADTAPGAGTEAEVRRHLADLYCVPTHDWELVRRYEIRDALPAVPPPVRLRRPLRRGDRLFAAGDHLDTASIQGALVSGHRAAAAVARRLHG